MRPGPVLIALALLMLAPATAADKTPTREPSRLENGEYGFQEVVQVEGVSAAELYSRARAWIALTYRSAKDVVQLDDKEAGRLLVKGNFDVAHGNAMFPMVHAVRHVLTIEVKDGRCRITISGLCVDYAVGGCIPLEDKHSLSPGRAKGMASIADELDGLATGLKTALKQESPVGKSDW